MWKKQVCLGKGYRHVKYQEPAITSAGPAARTVPGRASIGKTCKSVHSLWRKEPEGFVINTFKTDILLHECHRKSYFFMAHMKKSVFAHERGKVDITGQSNIMSKNPTGSKDCAQPLMGHCPDIQYV